MIDKFNPLAPRDRLMKLAEVADLLGVGESTIYRRIQDGDFPKPVKLGRSSRWKVSDFNAYVEGLECGA